MYINKPYTAWHKNLPLSCILFITLYLWLIKERKIVYLHYWKKKRWIFFYKIKSPLSNQKHLKLGHDTHWMGRAHVLCNLAAFSTRSCGFCSKLLHFSIICRRERGLIYVYAVYMLKVLSYRCRCTL